jgi:hypothetical protein
VRLRAETNQISAHFQAKHDGMRLDSGEKVFEAIALPATLSLATHDYSLKIVRT